MSEPGRAVDSWIERRATLWWVGALIVLLFAITDLPWHLDDYDQAKQAFTSFEMVEEGHWFVQHTPNEKIATKPPLVGWISAGIYGLTRSWTAAWRLPSMAAAMLLLVLLTRAASTAYGPLAGLLAMSAFGLNLLSPRLATLVRTDMPLALSISLIGLQIWEKVRAGQPWTRRDRAVLFVLLTAAMLIKGPIVYAFLLPGIAAFQLRKPKTSAWCGWWPWLGSLAVFLFWVAGGIAWAPGFYEEVVVHEFAGRFTETMHRPQPVYFYLPHLLHKFAPWSVLAIALAVVAWRREKMKLAERWRRLSPEMAWLLCWSLGGLVVMSLIPSKQVDRIFPVIPPLCLLLATQAALLSRDAKEAARVKRWSALALIVGCLATSLYAGGRMLAGYRSNESALVRFGAAVREQARAQGWRYEVIGGREEGLLLYLRRTHFITPEKAIASWKAGELNALVAPAEEVPALQSALPEMSAAGLEATVTINKQQRRYLLLTHTPAPAG